MASKRINITVPDDLYQSLERFREVLNVSGVCQEALKREVQRLESMEKSIEAQPPLTPEEASRIARRLRQASEEQRLFWFEAGKRYGLYWASNEALEDELRAVAEGLGRNAGLSLYDDSRTQALGGAKGLAVAIHVNLARKAKRESKRSAPRFDPVAFNLGLVAEARRVWTAISGASPENETNESAPET